MELNDVKLKMKNVTVLPLYIYYFSGHDYFDDYLRKKRLLMLEMLRFGQHVSHDAH